MKIWYAWMVILLLSPAVQPLTAQAETAQQAFAQGKALIAKADLPGALEAFARAARADRSNQEYLQNYTMVRQVLALRKQLETERDNARWEYAARGLRSFYVSTLLYKEALALDQKMHARLNTASSATMLAETQLALDMNVEAAETLAGLSPVKQTAATRALRGVALARQGKVEDASRTAHDIQLTSDDGPGTLYSVARLYGAIGNDQQALALLTRCLQSVAPSRQAALRDHANQCPAFAGLVSTAAFAKVLQTKSKVPESQCSGGSRCSSCPMRANCGKSQEH